MISIRQVKTGDAKDIADIYNYYVTDTIITFEEEVLSSKEIEDRIAKVTGNGLPWLVSENGEKVVGYAYASKWKERRAYRFSVEVSAYITPTAHGQGTGTQLYKALFAELKRLGSVHCVMGGIALPNPASVALHEKFGMKQVATFPEVGYKQGRWITTGYWQVIL